MDWETYLKQFGFDDSNIEVAVWLQEHLGEFNQELQGKLEEALVEVISQKNKIVASNGLKGCMVFISAFQNAPTAWHDFLAPAILIVQEKD